MIQQSGHTPDGDFHLSDQGLVSPEQTVRLFFYDTTRMR
jgi:hypothetical protein